MGEAGRRRRRVEPTDDWKQLKLLCLWPEQLAYEEIRLTAPRPVWAPLPGPSPGRRA